MQIDPVEAEWVVTIGAALVLLAGAGGAMARAAKRGAEWQARVEERWRAAAGELGGTLEAAPTASLSPKRLTLKVELAEATSIASVNVPVDPSAPSHTRARARFAIGAGPVFRMWERSEADGGGRERAVLPDRELVRRVRIDTDADEATAALFTPAVCEQALRFARPIALRSDGLTVELVWDGVEVDVGVLSAALGLVAELASSGTDVLRRLGTIDGARYVRASEGGPFVRVRREAGDVQLATEPTVRGPAYFARADARRGLPAFLVRIDEGTIEGELPSGVLDPDTAPPLSSLGACTLESNGESVVLAWTGEPSNDQAEAAVRLLVSIAAGSGRRGAFR